jgi:hypothetical protein
VELAMPSRLVQLALAADTVLTYRRGNTLSG